MATRAPSESIGNRRSWAAALFLAALVLAVYGQTRHFEFVSFDDSIYVYNNAWVKRGASDGWLRWAFSFDEKDKTYWHPLTWISHILDVELFGLDAGRHHLTNVLLHLANTLLLFGLLARMTGRRLLSAGVAACFAVHPINAESVAWVAERKNVLSTAFWMLTTFAYVIYAEKPGMRRYSAMLGVFLIGLLAKPMLVTLPCTLLLLDLWPLRRWRWGRRGAGGTEAPPPEAARFRPAPLRELILEKIPLLVLSLLVTWLAMGSLRFAKITIPFEAIPLGLRIENALVSYVLYFTKILFPTDLAMFYPYPVAIPAWQAVLAALALAGATAAALWAVERQPYITVGWLWFVGTLVPVSGILQVGLWPAWADRWAYIPAIGLFVILFWGGRDLLSRARGRLRLAALAAAGVALGALAVAGHRQVAVWENGVTLYRHAVAKVAGNYLAHNNLGVALSHLNRMEEALHHYNESRRINPGFPFPYFNLGRYHLMEGRLAEAEALFEEALAINPEYAAANMCMGEAQFKQGRLDKALHYYRAAQKLDPYEKKIHNDMGVIFLQIGQTEHALKAFQTALQIDPHFAEANNNIGFVYLQTGQPLLAKQHLEKALSLEPQNALAQENLKEALSMLASDARRPPSGGAALR